MNISALFDHAAFLTRTIYKSSQPPYSIASEYFRRKKYIGSKERRFLSECVFDCIRNISLYIYCFSGAATDAEIEIRSIKDRKLDEINALGVCAVSVLFAWKFLHRFASYDAKALLKRIMKINDEEFLPVYVDSLQKKLDISAYQTEIFIESVIDKFESIDRAARQYEPESLAVRYSMPEWIVNNMVANDSFSMKYSEISSLAQSFDYSAPLGLRVNSMLETRENVLEEFRAQSIEASPGLLSPDAIIVHQRVQLRDSPLYRKGIIEVQDEGSQLISYAAAPRPGMRILDACAGAGGKTLHLADITKDSAQILANDVEPRRLKEVTARSRRAGINNISATIFQSRKKSIDYKKYYEYFDLVLVDAPCSGMGTLRRNPMKKWTLTPKLLLKLQSRQIEILEFYGRFVRPGGALVYATCSIMPQENEAVAQHFLDNNPSFSADPIAPRLAEFTMAIPALPGESHTMRLQPDIHKTDAFFVARMAKDFNI